MYLFARSGGRRKAARRGLEKAIIKLCIDGVCGDAGYCTNALGESIEEFWPSDAETVVKQVFIMSAGPGDFADAFTAHRVSAILSDGDGVCGQVRDETFEGLPNSDDGISFSSSVKRVQPESFESIMISVRIDVVMKVKSGGESSLHAFDLSHHGLVQGMCQCGAAV